MRILFDQNIPHDLRKHLPGHEVVKAASMGWDRLENGLLLKAAEDSGFEVFITGDQNLRYQQNHSGRKISVIELTKNNWPSVELRVVEIADAVARCVAGSYETIQCGYVYRRRTDARS